MKKLDEQMIDYMIKNAAGKLADEISDEYPVPEKITEKYSFSPEFNSRVNAMIKAEESRIKRLHFNKLWKKVGIAGTKVSIAFCIIIFLFALVAFSIPPIRMAMMSFVITYYNDYLSIDKQPEPDKGDSGQSFALEYGIPYVPQGFQIVDKIQNDISLFLKFENSYNNNISFERHISAVGFDIDWENIEYTMIKIDDWEVYKFYKDGVNTICFNDDEYSYKITSNFEIHELMKIVEHILKK